MSDSGPSGGQFGELMALALRARVLARRRGSEGWRPIADALCAFFCELLEYEPFWTAAADVAALPPPPVLEVFNTFQEFEDQEHELLVRAGLPPEDAAELVTEIASALRRYQGGDLRTVSDLRIAIGRVKQQVCDPCNDPDAPELQRRQQRRLWEGVRGAGVLLAGVANLAAPPPLSGFSFAGAVLQTGALLAWAFDDN